MKTAITPEAYQEFIVKTVKLAGGIILERELDLEIIEQYQQHWSTTDLAPWGNQKHQKWKQNC